MSNRLKMKHISFLGQRMQRLLRNSHWALALLLQKSEFEWKLLNTKQSIRGHKQNGAILKWHKSGTRREWAMHEKTSGRHPDCPPRSRVAVVAFSGSQRGKCSLGMGSRPKESQFIWKNGKWPVELFEREKLCVDHCRKYQHLICLNWEVRISGC